ncbi:hypothetical protein BV20DRAFT_959763 [Pilatotrama ljubarskyi]|nr:hypothetical protein BV20DRAFT_959763 [Pilatotrama ljubarskyi]
MASTASPSTPSGGVGSSMWAGQPPSSRNGWSRNGESGSAFRGISRGRPGRGGGGGRGGRGARGGRAGGPNATRADEKASKQNGDQTKDQPKKEPLALTATSSVTSTSDISTALPPKPSSRAKEPRQTTRKASESKQPRKLPPIVVNPPPATSNNAPPSATTPNKSRRKRSQTKGSTSSVTSKKSPSSESSSSFLRAEKSPVIIKDLPPHLAPPPPPETPSFDIKHDIDALVERVRAVAMDRPHTPGSHIDWAGDDDDSLPDLDDWGVKSVAEKSNAAPPTQPDLISPLLMDALKPLPILEFGSPQTDSAATIETQKPASADGEMLPSNASPTKAGDGDNTPRGVHVASQGKADRKAEEGAPPEQKRADGTQPAKKGNLAAGDVKPVTQATAGGSAKDEQAKGKRVPRSPEQKSRPLLHPSLPQKPVAALDPPTKRAPRKPPVPAMKTTEYATAEEPPKSGLSESVDAAKPSETVKEDSSSKDTSPERQGLAASIHAPMPSSMSAPSHITTHTTHSTPSFHPTHGRAHTVGRPNGVRMPFSPSHGSFPDGLRPDVERASHRDRINHARTHSSPPTGPGTSTARARTVHTSRPVITGAAISQLMRSLGGTPPSKREAAAAAKE